MHNSGMDIHNIDLMPIFERFIKVRENLPILNILGNIVNVKREVVSAITFLFNDKLYDQIERIIDRSSKVATTATESLVKKDFVLDNDDIVMYYRKGSRTLYFERWFLSSFKTSWQSFITAHTTWRDISLLVLLWTTW